MAQLQSMERRLAYLGPKGTFTEQALRSVPEAEGSRLLPAATAAEALAYVSGGLADAAMLPVHNTVAGMVPDTLRALVAAPSPKVLREVVLRVEFALLVRPGTPLSRVRTVSGHPHAGRQVIGWLKTHAPHARWTPAPSNAEGARRVRDGECDAAVAGEFAAAPYGLEASVTGIQDTSGAATRFLLCARHGRASAPDADGAGRTSLGADRTSLIGRFDGRPELFGETLDELSGHPFLRDVSLHVVPHGTDGSVLFVDCPGSTARPGTVRAVGLLQLRLPGLRSMGSYVSAAAARLPLSLSEVLPYERSKPMQTESTTGADASVAPTRADISRLREQIDALDQSLLGMLRERLEASREIQRLRTGEGGSRVDSGREQSIRGRYADNLGEGGSGVAEAVLEMCRGRAPQ
ncbi:chorismate mutase [Streptomyces sp. NPDC060223]|uniref:chorismate mutase n=1 Tax=unclassified Streptomyces TaxID=2593676 RepID=UPI003637E6E0